MDESGNGNLAEPLLVGVAAFDTHLVDVEARVRDLYDDVSAKGHLAGFSSFDKFVEQGFHAAEDTFEVSIPFYDLIRTTIGVKLYMAITDRSSKPEEAEEDTIRQFYTTLIADLMLSPTWSGSVEGYIEENDALKRVARQLPESIRDRLRAKSASSGIIRDISIAMAPKTERMSIAIIDYAMHAVLRWHKKSYKRDLDLKEYRNFRAIEPSVSVLYSREKGVISNRRNRTASAGYAH